MHPNSPTYRFEAKPSPRQSNSEASRVAGEATPGYRPSDESYFPRDRLPTRCKALVRPDGPKTTVRFSRRAPGHRVTAIDELRRYRNRSRVDDPGMLRRTIAA